MVVLVVGFAAGGRFATGGGFAAGGLFGGAVDCCVGAVVLDAMESVKDGLEIGAVDWVCKAAVGFGGDGLFAVLED